MTDSTPRSNSAHLILAAVLAAGAETRAQTACYDSGSMPVAARWQPGPTALGCSWASQWPRWHLFTPSHRAPMPHPGFNPGDARELPSVLVVYRCTGFLLVPVVVDRVRFLGYVIDQPEYPCGPSTP